MHPLSTPWKHHKILLLSDIFRGWRKGALGTNDLKRSVDAYFVLHNVCERRKGYIDEEDVTSMKNCLKLRLNLTKKEKWTKSEGLAVKRLLADLISVTLTLG